MALTRTAIICTWVYLFSRSATIPLVSSASTAETITKCHGDNVMLTGPEVSVLEVCIFRNGQILANTSVQASGEQENRLLVHSDKSVTLTNLSSRDFGNYRVETKLSSGETNQRMLRMVVGEPPETTDGRLSVTSEVSNNTFIRLACGAFTSLGYPPVSVIWKNPVNQLLASTGFTDQFFTLDLPVTMARSGKYCCQIDCRDPSDCCLGHQSPLRQCAMFEVQTGETDTTEESGCKEDIPLVNVSVVVQQVSEIYHVARDLERSSVNLHCNPGHNSSATKSLL